MAKGPTIYDVARHAGVGISTVSHTLNRPNRVNEDTRKRVLAAIEQLGYQPKAAAMDLARKGTGRVGVVAPFTAYASFLQRLRGVMLEAAGQEIELVVYDHESAATTSHPLLSSVPVTRRVDGLLIIGLPLDDRLAERLLGQGVPAVLVDSTHPGFNSIGIDDHLAGYQVGRHLLEAGRRTIAYVSESQTSGSYTSQGQRRRAGVERALAEAGLPREALRAVTTSSDLAGGRSAARELITAGAVPDAFFAQHDAIAGGVLLECRAHGLAVPEDVSVIGFDDSDLAEALDLTTVRQPLVESGRLGLRQLLDEIHRPTGPIHQLTLTVTIQHRSTG